MMIRYFLFLFLPFYLFSGDRVSNDISGVWINSDQDAHIKIYSSYGKYYGQVIWMKNPIDSTTGKPQLDKFNKDPLLRSNPLMNMLVLKNLVFDNEEKEWSGGTIYNPKSGNSYDIYCTMKEKGILEMHFYLGIRSIGKLYNWVRLPE